MLLLTVYRKIPVISPGSYNLVTVFWLRTVPPIVSAHLFYASREMLPRARPRVSPDAYSMLTFICKKNTPQRAVCCPFYPNRALHLSLFRFPNNINLIGSAYFEFSVTPMRSRSAEKLSFTWKKWLFSVLFSLKITADLQNKLSGRVHVMTDKLLWNPKNVRDWSCFPFCNPAQCEIFVYVRIVFSKSRSAHFSELSEHKILKNCIYIYLEVGKVE